MKNSKVSKNTSIISTSIVARVQPYWTLMICSSSVLLVQIFLEIVVTEMWSSYLCSFWSDRRYILLLFDAQMLLSSWLLETKYEIEQYMELIKMLS